MKMTENEKLHIYQKFYATNLFKHKTPFCFKYSVAASYQYCINLTMFSYLIYQLVLRYMLLPILVYLN